jgi:hypothetical protein
LDQTSIIEQNLDKNQDPEAFADFKGIVDAENKPILENMTKFLLKKFESKYLIQFPLM